MVYTLWLKRSTLAEHRHWRPGRRAAACDRLGGGEQDAPLNAWLLCAIIFFWTPPHFWALSLYTQEDYAKAGVPMLPVVKGAAVTRRAILGYSLVVTSLALVLALTELGGLIYLSLAGLGGAIFIALAFKLAASKAGDIPAGATGLYDVKANAKDARNLFAFSILYLFCLFAGLPAERFIGLPPLVG